MNRMILSGALVALSTAAYAEPTLVDTRHVTKDGVTTQLARYQDPSNNSCTEYGLLTVAGKGVNDSKTICGASNILAANNTSSSSSIINILPPSFTVFRFISVLNRKNCANGRVVRIYRISRFPCAVTYKDVQK